MEDQYKFTAPACDTVALEPESCNLEANTEVVGVCKSFQHAGDQMEDYCEKEVVLDSDDERGEQNESVCTVNEEHFRTIQRFSGRDAAGLGKRQRTPAGYFRRVADKVNKYMLIHHDSARSSKCDDESTAGRTSLDNGNRYQDVTIGCYPFSSPDEKRIPTNAKDLHLDQEYRNMLSKCTTKDSPDEKILFSYGEATDTENDANYGFENEKLNYVETPESEVSLGKALEFVDHYLSISDLGSSKDVESKKPYRIKSPLSLMSKGSQSLARRLDIGFGSKSTTFDWAEQTENGLYTYSRKTKDCVGFEGEKSGCLSASRIFDIVNVPKEKISSLRSKEELSGHKLSPNDVDTDSFHPDKIDKVGSNPVNCTQYDYLEELGEQFDAGSPRQSVENNEQRVMEDTLSVGMDTQMAAEAMEALIYAAPPLFDACLSHQDSCYRFGKGSSSGVNKSRSKEFTNTQQSVIGWRNKKMRSKCVKVSTVKLKKDCSYSSAKHIKKQIGTDAQSPVSQKFITEKLLSGIQLNIKKQIGTDAQSPVSQKLITEKLLSGIQLNGRNSGVTRSRKCGRPPRTTLKKGEHEYTERDRQEEIQRDHCLAKPIGCKRRVRSSVESNNMIRHTTPPKRRRSMNLHNDVAKVKAGGKCLKSTSYPSCQVTIDKAKGEESLNSDASDSDLSKMNYRIYAREKRTGYSVTCHSNQSSKQGSTCAEIYLNTAGNLPPVKEAHKRGTRLLVYTRRRQFSSEKKYSATSLKLSSNPSSPSMNDNEYPCRQLPILVELDAAKPSKQFYKSEDGQFPSSVNASDHMKLADLSNGNPKTYQVCAGGDKSKEPFNPTLRSPLPKELTRSGYAESLPDFMPKSTRRQRARGKFSPVKEEAHKRGTRLLVYTRRRQFSSERKQSAMMLTSNPSSPTMNDNGYLDRQVPVPIELDAAKPSKQFYKSEDGQFPSSVDTSNHLKLADLSNGNPKILQVCAGEKSKKSFNPAFRSPLTKELTRLGYTESLPDFLPKSTRRRRAMEKVCVLFSQNLETSILKQQIKIISRLGFSIASCCTDATHFVTDRFVRTKNLLEAIAHGKPVVTHLWLETCKQTGCVIDEESYILRDEKMEKLIGFSMPLSLTRARQCPLLKGQKVITTPKVKQLKPGLDVIHCLVKAVNGQVVQNILSAKTINNAIPDDLLIMSCEEDYTFCLPFLEKGASIYSLELLLNGIITQKLEYDRHQLFKDFC